MKALLCVAGVVGVMVAGVSLLSPLDLFPAAGLTAAGSVGLYYLCRYMEER
jgi:hypothetical protein